MPALDKYRKVRQEGDKPEEHEIRVSVRGRVSNYITYAAKLFLEKKLTKCVIKGSGPAISKVCMTAEILRQRIKGLHEENKITSINIVDVFEPLEEGLDTVKLTKSLTVFEVILSTDPKELDIKSIGYQPPLPEDQVKEFPKDFSAHRDDYQPRRRGGRRGGRRGNNRGRGQRRQSNYDDDDQDYQRRPRTQENWDNDRPRRRGDRRGGRRGGRQDEGERRQYNNNRTYDNRRQYDNNDRPPRRARGTRRGNQ